LKKFGSERTFKTVKAGSVSVVSCTMSEESYVFIVLRSICNPGGTVCMDGRGFCRHCALIQRNRDLLISLSSVLVIINYQPLCWRDPHGSNFV